MFSVKSIKVFSILFFTMLLTSLSSALTAAELTITIKDITKLEGHMLVALYDTQKDYKSGESKWSAKVKVDKNEQTVTFKDLPAGDYAVKLYHDENDNNELDSNMFGIPKEGYGFSNNKANFGPSDYQEAKFSIVDNTAIEINLL